MNLIWIKLFFFVFECYNLFALCLLSKNNFKHPCGMHIFKYNSVFINLISIIDIFIFTKCDCTKKKKIRMLIYDKLTPIGICWLASVIDMHVKCRDRNEQQNTPVKKAPIE